MSGGSGERAAPRVVELIPAVRVRERIEELGRAVAQALQQEQEAAGRPAGDAASGTARATADPPPLAPLFVVIAEGARRFAATLLDAAARDGLVAETLVVRARRTDGQQLVPVAIDGFDEARCRDREVIVLDDIADEGRTLEAVVARVTAAGARRVRVGVLVSKHARRRVHVALDWVGFDVADGWIVGYGMDLDGKLRELDWIGVVEG